MKPKRLPVCGNLIGANCDGGVHHEEFCQNVATFTDGTDRVCADCAITLAEEYGIKYTPIEPQFWADLIEALSAKHRKEDKEYRASVEKKLEAAKQAINEYGELRAEARKLRERAEAAEAEVARLKPIAIELERFKRPLPTIAPTGIGGVVPDGQRLEIE